MSDDGTLVFCGQNTSREFWTVPLDANSGRVISNDLQKVARNSASDGIGIFARDGGSVVFNTVRNSGNTDIQRIGLDGSGEKAVVATPAPEFLTGLNGETSQVLYFAREQDKTVLYAGSTEAGSLQKICTACTGVMSPDGSKVYYSESRSGRDAKQVVEWDLSSQTSREAFTVGKEICFPCPTSRFSWDGRWVAALRRAGPATGIALFPLPDATRLRDEKGVFIGGNEDGSSRWAAAGSLFDWSPDGKLVYFASDRDGHRCIWAQRVDAITRRPRGEPFAVYHNHRRNSLALSPTSAVCLRIRNFEALLIPG